ncbi:Transcription factor/nuclear export subunit protein 2 family protein [Theileria parva strain Muguga]|uniref:THO complex subunitTHOC2 C-terminal domain-containing protein n=1 Tax=Theileria parva TaxID=5875 RepID=Q4N3V4_THEPA|nr:Transcription factor/nuclear export subunit protein 2 family protein [Theileria parva strain Muguga]EAN33169.1 Transcription factor/nuclear export subunit protein 2 family protein [Theileria parva strain Muguga]|eukprot:XP_765452.1 hypothetical protein [Theileria parva strain Muguga]
MIRKLYQTYNYKLRNIFKKITFELLKSVKSPTIRSIVSIITAISAINPFSVCTLIIRQSELFNNLLLPLCELTKYFLSYTIDIFVYQLTINLIHLTNNPTASSSRDTSPKSSDAKKEYSLSDNRLDHSYNLNEEESNKMYLNSVILCKIYKRHSECDIIPIVTILILILNYSMSNRLTLCPSTEGQPDVPDPKNLKSKLDNEDLVKLEITGICIGNYYNVIFVIYNVLDYLIRLIEIIGGMVDVDMNKMTQEQLLCQCGSYSLKNECLVSNVDDEVVSVNNKKSLVKVVCRPFFVNSLLLILGRLINELLYDSNFTNSKLLLAIVDKFNNLVILLINFLEINEQTHLLPSKELLLKYYTENHLQFMNTVKAVKEPGELTTDSQSTSSLKRKRMEFTTNSVDTMLDDNFVGFINSLSIYDIYSPTEQYDTYVSKLTSFLSTITTAGAGNTFRRAKRIKNRITTLETDKEEHLTHSNVVLERLKEVFKSFVKNDAKVGPHITTRFISRIVFSRLLVSELNALFCCKIVDLIMENKMNYFNYFDFVNCYTKMLIPMISSLTEREVINLSIFFNHSFHLIKGWVNNREAFEKLVYDNPCFCTTFKFQPNREFKYQQLLQVIKKWEYFILLSIFSINKPPTSTNSANSANSANSTTSASSVKDDKGRVGDLKNSAESEMASEPESVLPQKRSWIEIKNVVIFLNKVSSNFPITVNSSLKVLNFLKNVLKLAKQNNWQDVTVPSNTLIKLIQMYQNQNKYIVINIPATPSSNPASNPVTTPSTPVNVPSKNPTSKETSPRNPMSKETSPRSGPDKETSLKSVSSKETSPKTGSKESSPKTGNSKETSPRNAPVKESVKSSSRTSITHGTDKR